MSIRAVVVLAFATVLLAVPNVAVGRQSTPSWLTRARNELPKLAIRPEGPMKDYKRAKFGQPWADVDHNHCDTRNDILRRDLRRLVLVAGSKCLVESGRLHDPYTNRFIVFKRGAKTSSAVQIDHVVALADAWRTGAADWNANRRLVYANDPDVLLAVNGPSNEAKGDDDASQWLPPKNDCRYVARQIAVKVKYTLWLTPSEHAAIVATLDHC
jgi:hypothetical protein